MAKTCPSPYDVKVTSRDKGRQQHLVHDFVPVLWLTIELPTTVVMKFVYKYGTLMHLPLRILLTFFDPGSQFFQKFYIPVTVHRNKFLYNKINQMHQFPKFTPAWKSTCFGQFLCPSSGVYSLYPRHWYMSYRFVDSFRAGSGWNCVQWINSWWWAEELPETCRVSCRSKFGKLMHLVGFIIKKIFRNICNFLPDHLTCYYVRCPSPLCYIESVMP